MECHDAAAAGNLELLKQLRDDGRPWNILTCAHAALNGHLDVLQWASKNGCPWDTYTCANAAWNGHLDILQWARTNGCPWDTNTCGYAALKGHLDILQWAIADGCDHNHRFVLNFFSRNACVEGGVFPGHGCLVSGCSDDEKNEGLCDTHKAAVYSVLGILMCNDTAKLVLEIVCAH